MKYFSRTILGAYLAVLLWLVLFKFSIDVSWVLDYHKRSLNLIPFAVSENAARDQLQIILNTVVFIPLGLLMGTTLKQIGFWRKFSFIGMLGIAIELVQFVFAIGATDVTDLIANTSGGLVGLLIYSLCKRYIRAPSLDRFMVTANAILLVVVSGVLFSQTLMFQQAPGSMRNRAVAMPQITVSKDVPFIWPEVGQAAIGTVENGLVARSSDDQNPQPMASMAKVITALALLEKQPLAVGQTGPTYVMTSKDVQNYRQEVARDGSAVAVHEGMRLTQYQAMQMMLIASSNNMSDTLVEKIFGSQQAYVSYAQDMLQRMGLHQTTVADASGFSADTAGTPSDLVAIGIAALKNPVIAEIVRQQQAHIPGVGTIKNTNELLGLNGVIGLKTGTTDQAGACLLFAAHSTTKDGDVVTIVGVLMGDTDHRTLFSDTMKLLASVQQGLSVAYAQIPGARAYPLERVDGIT